MSQSTYYVGTSPHGYGGSEEVSEEQALAYAEAIAVEVREKFHLHVEIGIPDGYFPSGDQLPAHGFVQSNWRRIRMEVNAKMGWKEQFGGALWVDTNRCF